MFNINIFLCTFLISNLWTSKKSSSGGEGLRRAY